MHAEAQSGASPLDVVDGAGEWLLATPFCPELQIDHKNFCIAMCERLGALVKKLPITSSFLDCYQL
jgi:predicted YcjX-like family ATPase